MKKQSSLFNVLGKVNSFYAACNNLYASDYTISLLLLYVYKREIIDSKKKINDVCFWLLNSENVFLENSFSVKKYFPELNHFDEEDLILIFNYFKEIDNNSLENDFVDLFERAFRYITSSYNYEDGDFILHPNLTQLIWNMVNPEFQNSVFNPFASNASLPIILKNQTRYYGQEYNKKIWRIGRLRLLVHSKININYSIESSIEEWPKKQKFDVIFSRLPLLNKIKTPLNGDLLGLESYIIKKSINSLNKNGLGIFIINERILISTDKQENEFRQFIVNENLLQTVIQLPQGSYRNTNIKSAVLVIDIQKSSEKIQFINIEDWALTLPNYRGVINWNEVNITKVNFDDFPQTSVSREEIATNHYDLKPAQFLWSKEYRRIPRTRLIKFVNITSGKRPNSTKDAVNFVQISDLNSQNSFQKLRPQEVNQNDYKLTKKIKSYRLVDKPGVLISLLNNYLKPTYYPGDKPLFIDRDIALLEIKDEDIISHRYLIYVLNQPLVKDQVNAYSVGSIIPRITKRYLEKIRVEIPDLKEQKEVLNNFFEIQSEKDFVEYSLKKKALKESLETELKENNALLRHKIAGPLSNLIFYTENIQTLLDKKIKREIPDIFSLKKDENQILNLGELLKHLIRDAKKITEEVRNQTIELNVDFYKKSEINFKVWIENFLKDPIAKHPDILFQLNWINDIKTGEQFAYSIEANDELLGILFQNILNNIYDHAFIPRLKTNKRILIDIELDTIKGNKLIRIYISNTGAGLPSDFKTEDFIRKGIGMGRTGGTGIGGYYVGMIVDYFNGSFKFDEGKPNVQDTDLVTTIILEFPLNTEG